MPGPVSADEARTSRRRQTSASHPPATPAVAPPRDLASLQRAVGNQAVLGLLGQPSLTVQRSPGTWSREPTVATIGTYEGSRAFWMPIRDLVAQYAGLRDDDLRQRRTALDALTGVVAAWRANQAKNWWLSDLDKQKAAALDDLARLITDETDAIRVAEHQALAPRFSAPLSVGGLGAPTRGPSPMTDFDTALGQTPPWSKLGLIPSVMQAEVTELRDRRKCRVQVAQGALWTHDGQYRIDTGGVTERYVLCIEGTVPVLYASQAITDADSKAAGYRAMSEYPLLVSHAQIDGTVVGAGDFAAANGHLTSITNQSGTWRPNGRHLAAVLKLLVRAGIVGEDSFVTEKVTVKLFISRPDGYDVDGGTLVAIAGRALSGKLR